MVAQSLCGYLMVTSKANRCHIIDGLLYRYQGFSVS